MPDEKSPPVTAYLGLGGNVGDVLANMGEALRQLDQNPAVDIITVSPVYRTLPWGIEDQDWFHNACALIETMLSPYELLDFALAIEIAMKRERNIRWGPRTLDIDILIYKGVTLQSERLTLPHPRMHEREFVVRPLADIEPALIINGEACSSVLEKLERTGMTQLQLPADWWQQKRG